MKFSLPSKLIIFVLVLFALVITACLLWTPVMKRHYLAKYYSKDSEECKAGIRGILSLGETGREIITYSLGLELVHDRLQRTFCLIDVLVSDKKHGKDILSNELRGGPEEAEFLIEHWENYDTPLKNPLGSYPLHIAATKGFYDSARLMIGRGADVEVKDKLYKTPLHWAARFGHERVAYLLIRNKSDVNAKDHDDYTPCDEAEDNNRTETASLLRSHGAKTGEELRRSTEYQVPSTEKKQKK